MFETIKNQFYNGRISLFEMVEKLLKLIETNIMIINSGDGYIIIKLYTDTKKVLTTKK